MLSSITPLGERGRSQRYGVTVASYVVGSVLAGAVMGALLGALGAAVPLPGAVRLAAFGAAAMAAAALELAGRRPPGPRRQVDERWLGRYRGWVYGGGFGFQLGMGVATVVTSASVYAVLAAELLTARIAAGAVVGAVFGLVRAGALLAGARAVDPGALRALHARLAAARGKVRTGVAAGCGAVGAVSLALAALR